MQRGSEGSTSTRRGASPRVLLAVLIASAIGVGAMASLLAGASAASPAYVATAEPVETGESGLRLVPSGRSDASAVLDPEQFTGDVRSAYWIASQIPEVLNQLYCWCGCIERGEHRSNLACFEDGMGVTCDVCRGTAEIAYELVQAGVTDAGAIQAEVDEVWAPRG